MSSLFARKSVQDCENDIAGARRTQALARQVASHGARRRRHDRRGHLRHHGHRDRGRRAPAGRGSRHRPLVPADRRHLRVRGPLLRRVRRDGPDLRVGLHLRLRLAGRAGGLDHRVGPDRRVRGGEHRRGDRLVGLLPRAALALRRGAAGVAGDRLSDPPTWRRRRWPPARRMPRRACISPPRLQTAPHVFGFPFIANLPAFCVVGRHHHGPGHRHPGVGELQQRDGDSQGRHHPVLRRRRAHPASGRRTGPTRRPAASRPTASPGSARARRSSSSAISDSTPPPRRRRRPRTRRGTCRSGSS